MIIFRQRWQKGSKIRMAIIKNRVLGIWKRNIKNTKTSLHVKGIKSGKLRKRTERYWIEVQREKAEVRNNVDKEELLTDKNKKQVLGEFITNNRHERRKRKIRKLMTAAIKNVNYASSQCKMPFCISLPRVMPILPEKVNLLL